MKTLREEMELVKSDRLLQIGLIALPILAIFCLWWFDIINAGTCPLPSPLEYQWWKIFSLQVTANTIGIGAQATQSWELLEPLSVILVYIVVGIGTLVSVIVLVKGTFKVVKYLVTPRHNKVAK